MNIYSITYVNYVNNDSGVLNQLFSSLGDCTLDLYFVIVNLLDSMEYKVDISSINSVLDFSNIAKSIKVNESETLEFVSSKYNTVDIYLKKISKGYLYNNTSTKHLFKVFISHFTHFTFKIENPRPSFGSKGSDIIKKEITDSTIPTITQPEEDSDIIKKEITNSTIPTITITEPEKESKPLKIPEVIDKKFDRGCFLEELTVAIASRKVY